MKSVCWGNPQGPAHQGSAPAQSALTLEPLRAEGPDSLATDGVSQIRFVKLSGLTTALPDPFNEITTVTADDIFKSRSAAGQHKHPIPIGAKILRAILTFVFDDATPPHKVEISPPCTITYEDQADETRVKPFLYKHRFITGAKLNLLFILLALAAALTPDFDNDDDPDDDTPDDHHITHAA